MAYSVKDFANELKELAEQERGEWPPAKVSLVFNPAPNDPGLQDVPERLKIVGGLVDDDLLGAKAITISADPSAEEDFTVSWESLSDAISGKRSGKPLEFVTDDEFLAQHAWLGEYEYDTDARVLVLYLDMIGADDLWL